MSSSWGAGAGVLATAFLDFAGGWHGARVLDVGCGTGSLAFALAGTSSGAGIVAIDIAEPFVAWAAARRDRTAAYGVADALTLPFPDRSFDCALSLLALNFTRNAGQAVAEMHRVTRPGGTVAAAVWDFAGGLVYQRMFWDTAAALDPAADSARSRHFANPTLAPGALAALFASAGLGAIAEGSLTIRMTYASFEDYWRPIANAQGPLGDYVRATPPERMRAIEERVRAAYLSGSADGPRSMAATAWAVKARRPAA